MLDISFISDVSEEDIKQEKSKARDLRRSQWWKNRISRGVCQYCGGKFKPADLTMDHIVPIARGGRSAKGNVAPCCKDCNNRKKYMLPMEWQEYMESLK